VKLFVSYNILDKYGNYLQIIENNRKGRIWDIAGRTHYSEDRRQ
jgi:hypothetical protein